MNLPVEILNVIFSSGEIHNNHPWEFRYYNQVSKLAYAEAEEIKYSIISRVPETKTY